MSLLHLHVLNEALGENIFQINLSESNIIVIQNVLIIVKKPDSLLYSYLVDKQKLNHFLFRFYVIKYLFSLASQYEPRVLQSQQAWISLCRIGPGYT